jgi:hypothetical protein
MNNIGLNFISCIPAAHFFENLFLRYLWRQRLYILYSSHLQLNKFILTEINILTSAFPTAQVSVYFIIALFFHVSFTFPSWS